MSDTNNKTSATGRLFRPPTRRGGNKGRTLKLLRVVAIVATLIVSVLACVLWLSHKASVISNELQSATRLTPQLQDALLNNDVSRVTATLNGLKLHTTAARTAANDPLWILAGAIPSVGANFRAASEVTTSAYDVVHLGAAPLAEAFQTLEWKNLLPDGDGVDLSALAAAQPRISSAAHAVRESSERLNNIDAETLLPEISQPLRVSREKLDTLRGHLDAAADAAAITPAMLGADAPRHYLFMIQNNAESRASGGIPGALAVADVDGGKLTLRSQTSATALGPMDTILPIDAEQKQIYSTRLGKYMQDVNLTPDFPSAAKAAQEMWEKKTGERVDGVISIDPIALAYVLEATGSLELADSGLNRLAAQTGLPSELTSQNVVPTLLSDVYTRIQQPELQDAYFAAVAQEVFAALSSGDSDPVSLFSGITRATDEGRILIWSSDRQEQSMISSYALSGSIAGPSVSPAQFGVYFNDGTGAKMDYYVRRKVQLVKECAKDGYEQTTVRVTSTNTAPADAGTVLPAYVTGGGVYGVPSGSVQTNITVYGPVQAYVETAKLDGKQADFAPYLHSNRPVGILAVRLAPGESKTVELRFGKIVQHTEPNMFVTPTVQPVTDVVLPTIFASCD